MPRLRQLLKAEPAVWQHVGDLAKHVERSWIELIGGKDNLLKESVAFYVDKLKEDLAGPHATVLERLMAERLVACWLQWTYCDGLEAENPAAQGTRIAACHAKRQAEAHRRFISAATALATVKRLLPRTIEVEVVQKLVAAPSPAPIVAGMFNGDQPAVNNARTPRFNGVNRITGQLNSDHDSLGELLQATAAK